MTSKHYKEEYLFIKNWREMFGCDLFYKRNIKAFRKQANHAADSDTTIIFLRDDIASTVELFDIILDENETKQDAIDYYITSNCQQFSERYINKVQIAHKRNNVYRVALYSSLNI